jgi:hypothetical protein
MELHFVQLSFNFTCQGQIWEKQIICFDLIPFYIIIPKQNELKKESTGA